MNANSIRAFVAVEIPAETIARLGDLIVNLKDSPAPVKWVKPHGIHITLKFLGDIASEQVAAIAAALQEPMAKESPFAVRIKAVGGFPNLNRPRVLWAGIDDPANRLKQLSRLVDKKLAKTGFAQEKRAFVPHLTLGRVKGLNHIADLQARMQRAADFDGGRFTVHDVHLFQSRLHPDGAVYTILKTFPLRGDEGSAKAEGGT